MCKPWYVEEKNDKLTSCALHFNQIRSEVIKQYILLRKLLTAKIYVINRMVCVERLTKKMSVPRRKNLNLLNVFKKGKLLRDFDDLKPLFLISNFLLALLYIGTTLEYLTSAMFFRNTSTTNNDTTSTNKKRGKKRPNMVSQKQHYTIFFNKEGSDISFFFF